MSDINVVSTNSSVKLATPVSADSEAKKAAPRIEAERETTQLQPKVNLQPKAEVTPNSEVSGEVDTDRVLEQLNENIQLLKSYLEFEKDEDSERMIFYVKNSETGEVIRQVPAEEMLEISKNITKYLDSINQVGQNSQTPKGILADLLA